MNKNKIHLLNSHSRNLSRRQFVGLGLASATSTALAPGLFTLLNSRPSFAGKSIKRIPFLAFDLVGGAGLPGNFLVGGKGGPLDLLPSYSTLGWNPRTAGWDDRFGLPMAKPSVSKMMEGLLSTMSPEAQKKFKMGSINHIGRDDTSDNPLSILELLSSLEMNPAAKTSKPIGNRDSSSGGNSRGIRTISEFSAINVRKIEDLTNLASIGGQLDKLDARVLKKSIEFLKNLSSIQAHRVLSDEGVERLSSTYGGINSLIGGVQSIDPRTFSDVQTLYGINQNSPSTDTEVIRSGIVHNVLKGTTGPGVISIGGCDYHDNTQTAGDSKDLEIGREIGRAIELAHQRKTPLFIHVYSDGGVAAKKGSRIWESDNGEKSMSVIGFYNPDETPTYRSSHSIQIGHYTSGEGVERDTLVGASPSNASYVAFANYMNVIGRLGDIERFGLPFSVDRLESVLVFS